MEWRDIQYEKITNLDLILIKKEKILILYFAPDLHHSAE